MNTPKEKDNGAALTSASATAPTPHAEHRGGAGLVSGASLSNTAPAKCTNLERGTKILRTGVDSLYLSYRGELDQRREQELENLKGLAQSDDPLSQAGAVIELMGHRFEVRDKSKGHFLFVIVDNWFHIQIARRTSKSLPMIYAQIASEILTRGGLQSSVSALNGVVMALGEREGDPTISRVDLCADFITDVDLETLHKKLWVTRAKKFDTHHEGEQFSGFTIGLGGNLSCRLYDKTLEIKKSGKTYLIPLWREAGWDGVRPVWRLEFQFRRDVLKELGVNRVGELKQNLFSLWQYACSSWLRLTIPSTTDTTKSRWPNHPLWQVLSAAEWGEFRGEPLYRTHKTRIPSDKQLFINGIGAITSFMARERIKNIDDAFNAFRIQMHQYHLVESQHTGKTATTYAREKAQAKARKYNTKLDEETEKNGSDAYLRKKEGR